MCDERTGAWLPDWPTLLDFGDERLVVHHKRLDSVAITWAGVDPALALTWPPESDLHPGWRADPLCPLEPLRGQQVRTVELAVDLTAPDDTLDSGSVALSLALEAGDLTLHDAGDENGFQLGPPPPEWPRYPLT